jgi:hypothetical protein
MEKSAQKVFDKADIVRDEEARHQIAFAVTASCQYGTESIARICISRVSFDENGKGGLPTIRKFASPVNTSAFIGTNPTDD